MCARVGDDKLQVVPSGSIIRDDKVRVRKSARGPRSHTHTVRDRAQSRRQGEGEGEERKTVRDKSEREVLASVATEGR